MNTVNRCKTCNNFKADYFSKLTGTCAFVERLLDELGAPIGPFVAAESRACKKFEVKP